MIIHPQIRAVVLAALQPSLIVPGVTWFDGRPAFLDAADLPAVAVYLTDAKPTGDTLDADQWGATLHIEVFLKAVSTDSELDRWMESYIYPAMSAVPGLAGLIETIVAEGYDYQRDDEMATWGSADLKYYLTYYM